MKCCFGSSDFLEEISSLSQSVVFLYFFDLENHDGVVTHLEPDILECEVRWALESVTTNKASGGDGIPVAAAAIKSLQSCPTLCDPIDRSPPGSSVPGILQARTLEWVAISFSNA